MSEDEGANCLFRETFEVDAVPGRGGGCEDAWLIGELGRRVVPDAKTVAIVWTPVIEAETRVVGLG